ncbi:MAG: response regulator, partial [Leptospiraceae bacterium]|nr:response regulator [Leptospiraceae bacterium]
FFGYVYDRVWDLNIIPASFEGGIPYSYLSNFHHFLLLLSIVYTINQENVFQKEKDVKILNLEKSNLEHKEKILYMESKAINENLKVSELKNEFIRIIALSFKEPLQNIVGISESLLDHSEGDLNYDQSQSVHGVLQSSRLLINAINDLSDYSLLESGKLELKNLVFDINIMVEIVISAISPLIGSKDMVFVNKVQESLPLIEADENRLQLILYNLFYSSIQSAREGEIIVSAKPIPGFIKIYITYLGEPFELPTEKFDSTIDISAHNSNPVYNRLFNLMVTVRLVKAQGGRIKIYQEQNKTVIKFTIPVAKDQRKNVVSRKVFKKNWSEYELNSHFKELSGDGEGDQGNILIVDDESLNLETYRNYLEGVGFKVTVTNSGREALVLLNKKSFDLILVDMVMPYMSGPKLCELIREKHDKINLPILLLTNKYSTVDLIETLDYANDYIMKPLTREKLIARIKNLLNLSRMNMAYKRFVPLQMIKLLGKSGITEIKLGDQIEKEMTVLFSDLRSYTMLSEKMTPEENFEFLNTYFRRVGPMIRKHNGYIDKYMGDAIMAVFPNNSDDAVRSAIDIQKAISKFNKTRIKNGLEIIQAGIGIHTGDVILGTIGEDERMEGTVISDAVNLSSRLENLTKLYNASILITMDTFIALENQDDYTLRILDRVKVKGKEKFVTVIEILDGYDDSILEAMLDSKIYFEEGVTFYLNRDFDKALGLFSKVLEFVPDDKATKIYIQRAEYYKEHNVPVDWDGVEILEEKFY